LLQRIINFTPNFFTLSNLSCGVIALVFIVNHHPIPATFLVFASAFCDLLDGKVARKLKVDSEFGVELDSLSDVVSFGVVPALMVFETVPYHLISSFVLLLFPIGGALRLARFNTRPTSGSFEGLPITAAGLITAALLWFPSIYWLVPYIALLLAILMVSKIRVKKF
jgi:CDP-diacylglycerol---serine O-phosphatidyltransferase